MLYQLDLFAMILSNLGEDSHFLNGIELEVDTKIPWS